MELLYEELQKELWAVVRESLRSPTAGPNLGLVVQVSWTVFLPCFLLCITVQTVLTSPFTRVQVLQQEEKADRDWALGESTAPGGPRPRHLKQKWREAVEDMADSSLPQRAEFTAGQLDKYLDQLRARVVDDLGAAKQNVVSIYPEEYQPFQVSSHPGCCCWNRRLAETGCQF